MTPMPTPHSPGSDEVLSQSDGDGRPSDGHVPLPSALRLVPDLDVRPRHLPDLADLAALAPDHAANELRGGGSSALPKAQARPAPPSPTRALGPCGPAHIVGNQELLGAGLRARIQS